MPLLENIFWKCSHSRRDLFLQQVAEFESGENWVVVPLRDKLGFILFGVARDQWTVHSFAEIEEIKPEYSGAKPTEHEI